MKFSRIIFISVCAILFIIVSFLVMDYFLSIKKGYDWLSGGDWISIIIGSISSVSTIILGYISYWQNKVQREDNLRSEQRIHEQYKEEKEYLMTQHKIDVLTNNLNAYIEKLYQIDYKIQEKNFECDILDFITKIKNYKSLEDLRYNVILYKRVISENVLLINYIYNCIVYNKYYVDELDDCVIAIINLRKEMELYSHEQIEGIIKINQLDIKEIYNIKFADATNALMMKYLDFRAYWTIFLQNAFSKYESIIYKNNIDELIKWFEYSNKKTKELREKVKKIN